jgi:hypothetical protein
MTFTTARLDEVRALLDSVEELGDGTAVHPIPTTEAYHSWAEVYDEPGNQLMATCRSRHGSRATTSRLLSPSASRCAGAKSPAGRSWTTATNYPRPVTDSQTHVPGAPPNTWALHRWCTAATNAAYRDSPAVIIWHFQLG